MKTLADTLIIPSWLLTMEPDQPDPIEGFGLVIDHSEILEIGPVETLKQRYDTQETFYLDQHILLPGLINAHTHSPMVFLRALADDLRLERWLRDSIWPAEKALISKSFIEDGMRLAIAEMFKSGTTCINEHYFMPDVSARVCSQLGMRATIGLWLGDIETPWNPSIEHGFIKGAAYLKEAFQHDLIQYAWAPHSPYLLDNSALEQLSTLIAEDPRPVHIHCHETAYEVENSLRTLGMRPIERLQTFDLLNSKTILVHMVESIQEDLEHVLSAGSHIITCPKSNAKLASGHLNAHEVIKTGINLGIGTDSAASNNALSILDECRMLALSSKITAQDPAALSAYQCLHAATLGNAAALGLSGVTGSLKAGKQADLIAINLDELNTYPHHHPIAQLIYAVQTHQISHVWTQGILRLKERSFTEIDESELKSLAHQWAQSTKDFIQ
ncbi:MAG: N-ethylammeline chlorohydrolase [Legionellales bacterium]|nr:N-ethylammeline chlorohydrolase [Legionellales bacterium]